LKEGFEMLPDAGGFILPTSIAFVPNPGPGPKDPLYFVAELEGRIKVVTNDRTVFTFADDFVNLETPEPMPARRGQSGLAGLCLDPTHGYVFASFAFQSEDGLLRNGFVRFSSRPETFATDAGEMRDLSHMLTPFLSAPAHQVGPCQVVDDALLLSVGDGEQPREARNPDVLLGKILRMTLDGLPAPATTSASTQERMPDAGAPYVDAGVPNPTDAGARAQSGNARDYVWAKGLRNPFGLFVVGDRVFVADNGHDIDRFLEVEAGGDYLWDGRDWSLTASASFVFTPAQSPVELTYVPSGSGIFPEQYEGVFYTALAGMPDATGPRSEKVEGIMLLDYDFEHRHMRARPEYLARYRGTGLQIIAGIARGPDGLYFAPMYRPGGGPTSIYRLRYRKAARHPFIVGEAEQPLAMLSAKGCFGCHSFDADGGGLFGPTLNEELLIGRLKERLLSPKYEEQLRAVDELDQEPFQRYREARKEVLSAHGAQRLRVWMHYRLLEPKFDDATSQMPNLGLRDVEARVLTDYLLRSLEEDHGVLSRVRQRFASFLPQEPSRRDLAMSFLAGALIGGLGGLFGAWLIRLRRRRNTS
jgi:hypothetical protein